MNDWQGIESAPKDQSDVQVWRRGWLMPCPAYYISKEYLEREYDNPNHMEEGWYPSHGFVFELPEVVIKPTHWRPLLPVPNA